MGDVDEGDPDLVLDGLELDLHLLAELQVEGTERLVEQQDPGSIDQGPGKGDALALPAGELGRPTLLVAVESDHLQGGLDALRSFGPGHPADHQPVAHVVGHVHVRKQRIVLEDGVDVALERRRLAHVRPVEQDSAGTRQLEAGDHPQGRRLAGPGRPEHREELAVADLEVDSGHGLDRAEALAQPFQADRGGRHGAGARARWVHWAGSGLGRTRRGRQASPRVTASLRG